MSIFPPGICNHNFRAIPRQPDADIFYMHCTGGFRAARVSQNQWWIEPVLENMEPRSKGYLSDAQLRDILRLANLTEIGFERSGWHNGVWHSSWRPIIPKQNNHAQSPADIWGNISSNLFRLTRAKHINELRDADHFKVAAILDDRNAEERFAQSISLSLRSMDINVQKIAEHYNEQLVNRMYVNDLDGQRSSNITDQDLFAHVHAFFLHIGAARDYLAAFVAHRLGMDASPKKTDTMDALKKKLRPEHAGREPVLDHMLGKSWLVPQSDKPDRWETSGWLKEITDLRNEIVHRRPYGSVYAERFGWAVPISTELGLYRYSRPIEINGQSENDLLDIICHHYRVCTEFFFDAASKSNLDGSIITITDKDIISLQITDPTPRDQ